MKHTCLNPPELFNSTQFGFSQIVIASPGKHVFFSGQVAWDEQRNIVGKNDLQVQAEKTFANVEIAVAAAGGTLKDIVNLRIYILKNNSGKAAIIGEVLRKYFGTEAPPASTWISVDGLASEDFLIEVEAQAVI